MGGNDTTGDGNGCLLMTEPDCLAMVISHCGFPGTVVAFEKMTTSLAHDSAEAGGFDSGGVCLSTFVPCGGLCANSGRTAGMVCRSA